MASVLANASAAEAAGNLEDAADWLLAAIEREPSPARRGELEARRKALLDRQFEADHTVVVRHDSLTVEAGFGDDEGEAEADDDGDAPFAYEMLVSMLGDALQPLYRGRPPAFHRALIDLNEGRAADARAALEELATRVADDPVLRLELGRARLLEGDAAAARTDFEVVWERLGDAPLDAGGTQHAPALWAEACLAAGDPEAVVERLEALAILGAYYAASGDPEAAREAAAEAERLARAGEDAVATLEVALAPRRGR